MQSYAKCVNIFSGNFIWRQKTSQVRNNLTRFADAGFRGVQTCNPFLIFLFVKEEVVLGRVVRPDVLDALVGLAVVFQFLKVLDVFLRGTGTVRLMYQFIFGSRPWCIVQTACKLKCPIHIFLILNIYKSADKRFFCLLSGRKYI